MKRIALFGGTFDPLHFGHLNLAVQMLEIHRLDQVLFCPANVSPHKQNAQPRASKGHRRAMVELAIAPVKGFSLLTYELDRDGLSYTIDTVKMLHETNPKAELFLLLGELKGLDKWKDVDHLLTLAQPLFGSRKEKQELPSELPGLSEKSRKILQLGMTTISIMEISSTNIRERLHQKKYCGHLVPETILKYITTHGLY